MNLPKLPKTKVGIAYVIALGGLVAVATCLGAALYAKASAVPSVTVIGSGDGPRTLEPGFVPDALARDFANDFVVTWETYAPETVEAVLSFAKSRVSPSLHGEFEPLLSARRKIVRESGMVSQILLRDPAALEVKRSESSLEVIVRGKHRIYVAGKLAEEGRRIYRISLEAGQPTRENPTGLLVRGLSVKTFSSEEGGGHARPLR